MSRINPCHWQSIRCDQWYHLPLSSVCLCGIPFHYCGQNKIQYKVIWNISLQWLIGVESCLRLRLCPLPYWRSYYPALSAYRRSVSSISGKPHKILSLTSCFVTTISLAIAITYVKVIARHNISQSCMQQKKRARTIQTLFLGVIVKISSEDPDSTSAYLRRYQSCRRTSGLP